MVLIMKIKKLFSFAVPVIFVFLMLSGCAQQTANQPGKNDIKKTSQEGVAVSIRNFAFNPAVVDISKGAKVTWTNEDSAPHTVTSEGSFDSGTLSKGQSFSYVFDKAGTFSYKCSVHPSMSGKVVVS